MDLKTILILNYCFYNSFEIKEDKTRIFGWHHEFYMSQGWASIGDANTQRSKMTLYIFEKKKTNKQTNTKRKKELIFAPFYRYARISLYVSGKLHT